MFFWFCCQSIIALEIKAIKKIKNVFFMFSGIGILGRLTKKHKHFWISCHLLPLNECFSKNDLHLIALLSARENHKKTRKFNFLIFFKVFFLSFWVKSACQQCFSFYDFWRFWLPDPEILEKSMTKNQKRTATLWPRVAFYFPYVYRATGAISVGGKVGT